MAGGAGLCEMERVGTARFELVELVQLVEPELPAAVAEPRLGRVVGIPSQVAEVLHQDEGAVPLARPQVCVLGQPAQGRGAPQRLIRRACELRRELVTL